MKFLIIIFLSGFMMTFGHAQDTITSNIEKSVHIGGGLNWENKSNTEIQPFGIDIAENSLQLGYTAHISWRIQIKKKYEFGVQFYNQTQTRNKSYFSKGLANRHLDRILYQRDNIRNSERFGIRITGGYKFYTKNLILSPKVKLGFNFGPSHSYEYSLRIPSTNYFERFRISNSAKVEFPISIGLNLSHPKISWLEFFSEAGFANSINNYNIYKVHISPVYNAPPNSTITTEKLRLFWNLGISLSLNIPN